MRSNLAGSRVQKGSLWGEFGAKILRHWYLQCVPARKALKPFGLEPKVMEMDFSDFFFRISIPGDFFENDSSFKMVLGNPL